MSEDGTSCIDTNQYHVYRTSADISDTLCNDMELPNLELPKERLKWAAARMGCFKAAQLARLIVPEISDSGVRHHFNGTRPLSPEASQIYARKLGVPWVWLFRNERNANNDVVEGAPVQGAGSVSAVDADVIPGENISVPEVDVRAGMGGGGVYATEYNHTDEFGNTTSADNVKAVWSFPTAYVRDELRSPASKVWLLEVKGDSMEPTLRSGDRVMVDTSDINPAPGGVFALYDGLSVIVKRLDHIMNSEPPKVRVISDNPRHGENTYLLEEVRVIGRVVWFGRRL